MSRLLSFLKKKDKDAGVDYTGSPPLSPKADKEHNEVKSVKHVKKRHQRRDKRKAPLPQASSVPIGGGDVHESLGHSLVDDTIDANGNSMTGKSKTAALNNGDPTAAFTSKSTGGEADSLRDVDSICEDETEYGTEIDNTVVSAEPYFVGGTNPDLEEAGPAGNGIDEDAGLAPTPLPETIKGCDSSGRPELKYVSSFSDSGENILIDDFMDEALDDLEDDLDDDTRDGLNGTVESDIADKEESSVRMATPVNSYPEADASYVESNSNLPQENGALLESSINGHASADLSDRSTSVVGGRLLSTDTVGTINSSCDPGSDYYESALEELPNSTNGGEPMDVLLTIDGCAEDSVVGDNPDELEVSLRPKTLNFSAKFTDSDAGLLEVCFEVESQGRTSVIVTEIIEARNCLRSTAEGDQLGIVEPVDQTKVHDESSDAVEVSLCSASDTLRHSGNTSLKCDVDDPQKVIVEENDRESGENETRALNSTSADISVELSDEGANDRLHFSDGTELQSETSEVSPSDPSAVSDTKDIRGRPESVGAVVDCSVESSLTLGDSPVSVGDTCNITPNCDTNLVNGGVSEVDRKVIEPTVPVIASISDTDVLDTSCEERICDDINGGNAEKEKSVGEPDADSTAVSDVRGRPAASTAAGSKTGDDIDDDGISDDVRSSHCGYDVGEGREAGTENTRSVCEDQSEPARNGPTPTPDAAAGSDTNVAGSEQAANHNVTVVTDANKISSEQALNEPPLSLDVSASSDTPSTPSESSRKSSRALRPQASLEEELEKHGAIIEDQAEAQLAQRRAARAEARELRLKELERQQQQNPENADDASDMSAYDRSFVAATDDASTSATRDSDIANDCNDQCLVSTNIDHSLVNTKNDISRANTNDSSLVNITNDSTLNIDSERTLTNTSDHPEESGNFSGSGDRLSQSFSSAVSRGGAVACRSSTSAGDAKEVHFFDLSRYNKYRKSFSDISEARKEKERSEGNGTSFQCFGIHRKTLSHLAAKNVAFGDLSRYEKYRRSTSSSSLDKEEGEFTKVFRKNSLTLPIGETISEDPPSKGEDTAIHADSFTQQGLSSSSRSGVTLPKQSSRLSDCSSPPRPLRRSTSLEGDASGGFRGLATESPTRPFSGMEHRLPLSDMVGVRAQRKSLSASGLAADSVATKSPPYPRGPNARLQQPSPKFPAFDTTRSSLRSTLADGGSGGRLGSRSSASRTPVSSAVPPPPPLPHYSRRSSEESNNEEPVCKDVRELEEKFRVAMINNASLDNDKTRLTFQIEELKDCRTDLTEQLTQLKKEHKKKCSEHEQLRKVYAKLQEESRAVRRVLEERDELIQEYGLVVVGGGDEEEEDGDDDEAEALAAREETEDGLVLPRPVPMKRVLLTQEAAEILQQGAAKGSLEWRLRRVVERKRELEDELRRVNLELAEQVNTQRQSNCIDSNIQKEANKTVNEYKFRVQKAEAEVSSLQANVNRLEALVTRYKTQTEELERSEEELKAEKRRLQRELREATSRLDELETANSHLVRRFELLRNARSNLLREMSQDPI